MQRLTASQRLFPNEKDKPAKTETNQQQPNKPEDFPYPLPPGKPAEPPDYLKRGSPYYLATLPNFTNNDDLRTEEERDKEFWDRMDELAAKGLLLTAEQAKKVFPDSCYFAKPPTQSDGSGPKPKG